MKRKNLIFKVVAVSIIAGLVLFHFFEFQQKKFLSYEKEEITPFHETGLYVHAKALNETECRQYLKRDLLEKGYVPILISVQNNTANGYSLSEKGIDQRLV